MLHVHSPGGGTFLCEMMSWHQIKNMTLSVDVYLLEEQPCQIPSRSDLKRLSLKAFWRDRLSLKLAHGRLNLSFLIIIIRRRRTSDMRSVRRSLTARRYSQSILTFVWWMTDVNVDDASMDITFHQVHDWLDLQPAANYNNNNNK